jgi:sterol desaturase/sphingolipid hydroxylase (fatty acid hydroxylase superfamily)
MEYLAAFFGYTLMLWVVHFAVHKWNIPGLTMLHDYHHKSYFNGAYDNNYPWYMLIVGLQTTDKKEVFEQVVMEWVPTVTFCAATGHWWILLMYWVDGIFLAPYSDHDCTFRWWFPFGLGRFHTNHHDDPTVNYGFYSVWWDWLFRTFKRPVYP